MIQMQDIKKKYQTGPGAEVHALRGISLTIEQGEFVAIVGPSGCGKSTLMNILGTLDRPDSGRYLLHGEDVAVLEDKALSMLRNRRIGFVFQSFNLLPLASAQENVSLPLLYAPAPGNIDERSRTALERVGLGDRAHHRPGELSGGQQQRVAIARALVTDPEFILADEPTGNLDTRASAEVMAVLEELAEKGKTVVLVTHEPDIAAYTRRVIALRDGQVFTDTPNAELKSARQELERLGKEVAQ
jgi:putative ABC transport system ATP-binding protein